MIRIVLIGNETEREGIHKFISTYQNLVVQALGNNYFDAANLARRCRPDILLLDAALGVKGGEGILPSLKLYSPDTKIVVFGIRVNDFPIHDMARGTLQSYLVCDSDFEHLETILDGICRGKPYVNFQLYSEMCRYLGTYTRGEKNIAAAEKRAIPMPFIDLSKTEINALCLLVRGKSDKEIAAALNITDGTVRNYFSSIMKKTGTRCRTKMILYAQTYGITGVAEFLPPDSPAGYHLARPDNSP